MAEKKITVDDIRINHVVHGKGPKNILCLPGELGTWQTDFGPILDRFDVNKYTVVAMDPPGHGESRPPERRYYYDYCKDDAKIAAQLMQKLNLTPFSVLGWSEGGRTAFHLAHDFPELVTKLIEWGANTHISKPQADLYRAIKNVKYWKKQKRETFESIYGHKYLEEKWAAVCDFYVEMSEDILVGGNLSCHSIIDEITQPMLILNGGKRHSVTMPEDPIKDLIKKAPNAKYLEHAEGGFELHFDSTDWFMQTVEEFLAN